MGVIKLTRTFNDILFVLCVVQYKRRGDAGAGTELKSLSLFVFILYFPFLCN